MASTVNPILTSNKDGEDTVWAFRISQASSGGGSGVSRIVAGTNVTVSPPGGTGVVTVNSSGGGGAVASVTADPAGVGLTATPTTGAVVVKNTQPASIWSTYAATQTVSIPLPALASPSSAITTTVSSSGASTSYQPLAWSNPSGNGSIAIAGQTGDYCFQALAGDTVIYNDAAGKQLILRGGGGTAALAITSNNTKSYGTLDMNINQIQGCSLLNGHELYVYGTFQVPSLTTTSLTAASVTNIPLSQTAVANQCGLASGGPAFSMDKNGDYRFIMNFGVINNGATDAQFNCSLNYATGGTICPESIRGYIAPASLIAGLPTGYPTMYTYSATFPSYPAGLRLVVAIYAFAGTTLRLASLSGTNSPAADLNIELMG